MSRTPGGLAALGLALAVLCAGCDSIRPAGPSGGGFRPSGPAQAAEHDAQALERELDAQLGELTAYITDQERAACLDIWRDLRPLHQARIERGEYAKGEYEQRLVRRLNRLYESYTVTYLNPDDEDFGYENPRERVLASYAVSPGGALTPERGNRDLTGTDWAEPDFFALWQSMLDLLPEGAFDDFGRLTVFTDGPDETMAYVYALDDKGSRWEIALDPADSGDGEIFTETVLHEYFHYLSLNDRQVTYTTRQTVDTYNEAGMVSHPGSYLDDFYQRYWKDYLDDCLACPGDTYNFFLRHYDDFIDPYASTDPSEDICESFTFFVLRPKPVDVEDVWEEKLEFFYEYPELTEFRQFVRASLDLAEDEYYESDYYAEDAAA